MWIKITGYAGGTKRIKDKPPWVDLQHDEVGDCYLVCHHCGAEPENLGSPHISEALAACQEHTSCKPPPRKRGMVRMKGAKNGKNKTQSNG